MKAVQTILVLVALGVTASGQSNSGSSAEQRFFNLEDAIHNQVNLSDAELTALSGDAYFKSASQSPGSKLTQDGLQAAVVHLCSSGERDLVVIGDGDKYTGANVAPFWIIRNLPTGPQVVLQSGMLGLTIDTMRSKKCLNILAVVATAVQSTTTEYRFDGTKYVKYKEKSEQLGQ